MAEEQNKKEGIDNIISNYDFDNAQKSAENFEKGLHSPRNKIVLLGIWVLMGATALICTFVLVVGIYHALGDGVSSLFEGLPMTTVIIALLIFSITVLYNVTKNYLKQKRME